MSPEYLNDYYENSLNLYKFMGLVLPKNTVVSESISNDTKLIKLIKKSKNT